MIEVSAAAAIIRQLPPFIIKTGVFVNAAEEVVLSAARNCGLNLLQFHGDEPAEFCLGFGLMSMKAFRVKGPETLQELRQYPTDAWLLDAYTPGHPGGTGERFDWALAAQAQELGRPVFLAGGLNPGNIAAAIREARPSRVDVSSGVELRPGKKDHQKLRGFIETAKQVEL